MQTILNIAQKNPAIMKAMEIIARDYSKFLNEKIGGTTEVRISYDHGIPVSIEEFGREKHIFKKEVFPQ